MNNLFTPFEEKAPIASTTENPIVDFICQIEGWKTKIKNLHWSAPKMNTHKVLDEIADFVAEYQDALAEDYMGINGKFMPNILKGIPCDCLNAIDLMIEICTKTTEFYNKIPSETRYTGIKSETETFIHNINKYIYLVKLCDTTPY